MCVDLQSRLDALLQLLDFPDPHEVDRARLVAVRHDERQGWLQVHLESLRHAPAAGRLVPALKHCGAQAQIAVQRPGPVLQDPRQALRGGLVVHAIDKPRLAAEKDGFDLLRISDIHVHDACALDRANHGGQKLSEARAAKEDHSRNAGGPFLPTHPLLLLDLPPLHRLLCLLLRLLPLLVRAALPLLGLINDILAAFLQLLVRQVAQVHALVFFLAHGLVGAARPAATERGGGQNSAPRA
mmetsp:Transcript_48251/g.140666  ORF Transcript_48251/g.140666 Transcript_48251/m.140666 type:complete len:241 (-) Transcript_48251:18-740(-)